MNLTNNDFNWLLELLKGASRQEIMPRFRQLSGDDISAKRDHTDLVTIADVGAEKFITAGLKEKFPEASIIGEETVSADDTILDAFPGSGVNFIIDPIDGTFNFANGITLFATILAVVENGETTLGIIYDPVMEDCIYAKKGEGAFYHNTEGVRSALKMAETIAFEKMTGMVSWNGMPDGLLPTLLKNQTRNPASFNYRCGAQAYKNLTGGGVHYAVYGETMPWDHLAGSLIVEEAGGHVACFDGSPYGPRNFNDGLIHAPNKDMWEEVRRELWK